MEPVELSVIIPAHNEEGVIEQTLDTLLRDREANVEIILVCNGCTDNTVKLASAYEGLEVIDTARASKTHALNLGDASAGGKCRVYMDADVVVSGRDLLSMMAEMKRSGALAITPKVRMDYSGASLPVRMYYAFWLQLPYVQEGFVGGGVYMISARGRERFGEFPDLISDDGFVRSLFSRNEICRSEDVCSVVRSPRTVGGLIKIFTRSRVGQYQLFKRFPQSRVELQKNSDRSRMLLAYLLRPQNLMSGFIYLLVNFVCRIRARAQFARIDHYVWEKDVSTRV